MCGYVCVCVGMHTLHVAHKAITQGSEFVIIEVANMDGGVNAYRVE